jgi:hypothetical protein
LVFFVDETGHEELAEGHHVFGLGGCAALGRDLDRLIQIPWKKIRKAVAGDENVALHATDLNAQLTAEQQKLIGSFFTDNEFARIGVASTTKTELVGEIELMTVVARTLANRIIEIVRWSTATSIAVVFESNNRIAKRLEAEFGPMGFSEDGKPIPVDWYFMDKGADPALDVADFIANTMHGMAIAKLRGRAAHTRKDFEAVFKTKNPKLSSFMFIDKVEKQSPTPGAS